MFPFLKNIKKGVDNKVSLIILISVTCLFLAMFLFGGCASQARQTPQMDSIHYRAQVEQTYPCPECGFPIPDKKVSPNIRMENKCPDCQKIFFGVPVIESKDETEFQGKPYKGPKIFGRGYYSDIKHGSKFDHSVKNTWKVSPDGSSGSMSQTFIRTYEHTTKGEHGAMVGPAGLGHYGGY